MSLPDLFLKDTVGFDESLTKLPQDMDLWSEKIITIIKQKIPEAKDLKISVSFLKQNEEMGVATGSATLFDSKINKKVYLPIIVKNFTMYPLDVMMVGNDSTEGGVDTVPFDLDAFRGVLENSSPFGAISKPLDRLKQMYMNPSASAIHPPTYRHVYASEGGAILSAIKGDVDKKDVEKLKEDIKENKDKLKGYDKNSNLEAVKSAVNLDSDDDEDEDASEALKVKVAFIRKVASDKSEVVSVGSESFHPTKRIKKIPANVQSENGSVGFKAEVADSEAVQVTDGQGIRGKVVDAVSMKGSFVVSSSEDIKGLTHKGVFFKTSINPLFNRASGPMFINENVYSNSGSGKTLVNTDDSDVSKYLPFDKKEVVFTPGNTFSMFGVVKTEGLNKELKVSIPIKVEEVDSKDYSIVARCSDELGQQFLISTPKDGPCTEIGETRSSSKVTDMFGSTSKENGMTKLYVGANIKFMILGKSVELSGAPSDRIKTASRRGEASKVRVIGRSDNTFALRGGHTEKMASILNWDKNNLAPEEVSFILAAKDCPLNKIAKALKVAGSNIGESSIYGLNLVNFNKQASAEDPLKEARTKIASSIKCNLFKEAASIADGQVVDSVLSLNFINESNLGKFINFIPLLKQSAGALARLVLASRLGVEELSNNDVTKAMQSITNVIKSLEKMKGLNEKNAQVKVASISKIEQKTHAGISFLDFL